MPNRFVRKRSTRLFYVIIFIFSFLVISVVSAWMFPGFVESHGFLEPESRVPVYAPIEGVVFKGTLRDGLNLNKGDVLLGIDKKWREWNLKRLQYEILANEINLDFLYERLNKFRNYREVEEGELNRLLEIDRQLFESASIPGTNLKRREYNHNSFVAEANQDEVELQQEIVAVYQKGKSLRVEEELWRHRLDECELIVPVSGTFFTAETLMPETLHGAAPLIGPGRFIEEGRLLGYIIPDDSIKVHVLIPQKNIARVESGQEVLISMAAMSPWRFKPLRGKLLSINAVATIGFFKGVVEIAASGQSYEEVQNFYFGDLIARIIVSRASSERFLWYAWEHWTVLINSIGDF